MENQPNNVVHVNGIDQKVIAALDEAMREFQKRRPIGSTSQLCHKAAAYQFGSHRDAELFAGFLAKRGIKYSFIPSKEFNNYDIQDLSPCDRFYLQR